MEDDPILPAHKPNLPETLVFNFFEKDPYTRRHRSRSMAGLNLPMNHGTGAPKVNGVTDVANSIPGGVTNGNGNSHMTRLKSAEV